MMLRMMITAPLMCIGGIIMALKTDRTLALVIIAVLPVLAFAIFFIARKGMPFSELCRRSWISLIWCSEKG